MTARFNITLCVICSYHVFPSRLVLLSGMSGSFVRSIGSKGNAGGQFNFPRSIKAITVGAEKLLIVADTGTCMVLAANAAIHLTLISLQVITVCKCYAPRMGIVYVHLDPKAAATTSSAALLQSHWTKMETLS
jgi:hypothetical protein